MSDLSPDFFTKPVADVDPEIAGVLKDETARQERTLEMIASENFVPQSILDCQGSVLTNKYAEGYPGKRYYSGCEYVDVAEQLAIDRAKELFGAEHANVQPHSGAQANSAVYMALLEPGDRILGMKLDHGGHLTHGMRINFSGLYFDIVGYGVREEDSRLDMDELQQIAEDARPKLIIAGWSAYPRQLDFQRFREIADSVGALLMADMAHFAGLVAAEEHPSPVPYCDVVTTTTHKTLAGPRGGMILCKEEYAKKINSRVFPGHQGGPLMHAIAGKAVAFKIARSELFRERQRRTREGAAIVAEEMLGAGVNVLTGGTDVHLVLADLRESELDGQQAEDRLDEIGITVNRNAVPFDPRPPAVSSGIRIGTPALATRGFQDDDFREVGRVIGEALGGDLTRTRRRPSSASAPPRSRSATRCTRSWPSRPSPEPFEAAVPWVAVTEAAPQPLLASAPRIAKPRLRGVSHQWAFFVSCAIGAALVIAAPAGTPRLAAAVYAVSVTVLFGVSALYHRVNWASVPARRWMRRLDHSAIFILIAGTYTPFALLVLDGALATVILVVVWAGALGGILLKLVWIDAPKLLAAIVYVALGWVAVAAFPDLFEELGVTGAALVVAGGVLYTAGALVYALKRPDPVPTVFGYHEVFHALVIVAAALQYAVVAFYVLPAAS